MDRRKFLVNSATLSGSALLTTSGFPALGMYNEISNRRRPYTRFSHRLPESDIHYKATSGYIEEVPVPEYSWAPDEAYEAFLDMKFGIRLHWGIYAINQRQHESWQYLQMSPEGRFAYDNLYKAWDPVGFDADEWTDFFVDSGAKMFSFTSKHHDGFSMFDTKTKVRSRGGWVEPGGPERESCNLSYSIMETPFKRDVVKELCDAAHKRDLKIDLYYSHPDWYDADFRPYSYHPLQVPDAGKMAVVGREREPEMPDPKVRYGNSKMTVIPRPNKEEVDRMMKRHRTQLEELITKYGTIDMVCLDQWLGPEVWPQLRETMIHLRKLRPNIMYRARGIGNYGDYYTPERFVPASKENTNTPWFVIYPLGKSFSYDPRPGNYKGAKWIIKSLIDAVAKGGNFMAGIGPDGNGKFHPKAIEQLKKAGAWLRINGKGIYATRARDGNLWSEGGNIRFTESKDKKVIYAFAFAWPEDKLVLKTVRPRKGAKIQLMGAEEPLRWTYDSSRGLVIDTPGNLKSKLPDVSDMGYGFIIPV